jgi:hypothetical protein
LAIAHGGLGAHSHSDWFIDCVTAVNAETFSWANFLEIVARRRLSVPAIVVLSYLSVAIGIPVPAEVIDQVARTANQTPWHARLASLLEAKPRTDMSALLNFARWVAKKARQKRERFSRPSTSERAVLRGRKSFRWGVRSPAGAHLQVSHPFEVPAFASYGAPVDLSLLVEIAAPRGARRIEMEVNAAARHIAQLRYRKLTSPKGLLRLRYDGRVRFRRTDRDLIIEARPIRQVREEAAPGTLTRFGALPFRLLDVRIEAASGDQKAT